MSYYKITKEQLLKFYSENVETFNILPTYHASHLNFERLYKKISYYSPPIEELVKDIERNNTSIIKALNPKINDLLLQALNILESSPDISPLKEFQNIYSKIQFANPKDNEKYNQQVYSKISPQDNISLIITLEQTLNINLVDEFDIDSQFINNFIQQYLFNQEKIDNFQRILSTVDNKVQTSLIKIDFGTENEISLDPILNISGLNQAFSAKYLDNSHYIIYSESPLNLIKKRLGNIDNATQEEILQIFNNSSNLDYISFKNLDDLTNISVNDVTESKEMDLFEESLILMSNNILNTKEKLDLLLKVLTKYENDNLQKTHEPIINQLTQQMVSQVLNNPEIFQNEYIKTLKDLFVNKEYKILKHLSPDSKIFGDHLLPYLDENFFDQLLEKINLVEAASLFFNSDKKYYLINSNEKIDNKDIENGFSIKLSHNFNPSKNCRNIIQTIINKINKNDLEIYSQFKADPIFNTIQQDIYPLLPLSSKLKYNNYECFHLPTNNNNRIDHISSIPMALFDDDIIANNIIDKFFNKSHYNESIISYVSIILEYKLTNELDNALTNNSELKFNKNILSNRSILNKCLDNFIENNTYTELLTKLLKYNENYSEDKTCLTLLHHLIPKVLRKIDQDKISIDHNIILKTIPFIANIQGDSDTQYVQKCLLSSLFNDSDFKENNHINFILDIYIKNNDCFDSRSPNRLKKFFRSPEVIEKIIELHKQNQEVSKARSYNISSGFQSNNSFSSIFTKAGLKQLHQFKLDLFYISPTLVHELPPEILNDKELWKKSISKFISIQNKSSSSYDGLVQLPQEMKNDYSFFKHILKISMNNLQETGSLKYLIQFPKHFINKQENVLTIFETLSIAYQLGDPVISNACNKIQKLSEDLVDVVNNLKRKSRNDNKNYFEQVFIKLQEEQMSKNINLSESQKSIKTINKM